MLGRIRSNAILVAAVSLAIGSCTADSSVILGPTAALPAGWYRGNTHTHTTNSDGDSPAHEVVRWYRDNGYHFLILSDHNALTDVDSLNARFGALGEFLLVPGEEVSNLLPGKPLDVTAVGIPAVIPRQFDVGAVGILQRSVDATRALGGVPIVNHPNFYSAVGVADLEALRDVRLFELYNGTPNAQNGGGAGSLALEVVWDRLLSQGKRMYGVAADDAHLFQRPPNASWAGPGKGWVVVRADALTATTIMEALDNGEFYSSTGIELEEYVVSDSSLEVRWIPKRGRRVRVEFIGRDGVVLGSSLRNPAIYAFRGDESYVRARAIGSDGTFAWMQPVFRAEPSSP